MPTVVVLISIYLSSNPFNVGINEVHGYINPPVFITTEMFSL